MLKSGGTDVATCYANRRPVEKSKAAKATLSNVELDTGGIKTSWLERSVRRRSGGKEKDVTAAQTSFICTSDTCLEPVEGPSSCKSGPSPLLDLIQTSLSQQQRRQKGELAERHETELASTNQSIAGCKQKK